MWNTLEYYNQLLNNFRDAYRGVENILSTLTENREDNDNE